jgi:hypothetical protein
VTAGTLVAVEPPRPAADGAQCRLCQSPLAPVGGRGRPASYCNARCRRLAEFRVRRLRRRHAELEVIVRVAGVDERARELVDVERELAQLGASVRYLFISPLAG